MDFTKSELRLNNFSTITVIHNLPVEGENNIEDAFSVWSVRTTEFSAEAFCNYINEKRKRGLCDYYAFPNDEAFLEGIAHLDLDMEEEDEAYVSPGELRWVQLNHQVHKHEFQLDNRNYLIEIIPFDIMPQDAKQKHRFPRPDMAYLIYLTDSNITHEFTVFMDKSFTWATDDDSLASKDKKLFEKITDVIMDIYTDERN